MKPVNQSDIKKQRLLFSLSLLSLIVATGLFTSAFFWSANSEIEWTTDLRKEHASKGVQIDSLKHYLVQIEKAISEYEEVKEGDIAEQTARSKVERSIDLLKSIPADQPDLKDISNRMNTLLSAYFTKQKDLNGCLNEKKGLQAEKIDLKEQLTDCKDELKYIRPQTSPTVY